MPVTVAVYEESTKSFYRVTLRQARWLKEQKGAEWSSAYRHWHVGSIGGLPDDIVLLKRFIANRRRNVTFTVSNNGKYA